MKKIIIAVLAASVTLSAFSSCTKSNKTIIRAQHIEEGVSNPQTIEEYEDAIEKYEARGKRIEEEVEDLQLSKNQIAIWHKIVGSRYIEKGLYGDALNHYIAALEITPDNQNLYYYVGLCSSYMANVSEAKGDTASQRDYLKRAESAYKRALSIEPRYSRALYAISALYDFEFGEAAKAIPYLETLLSIEKKHLDGILLLARCYYETYQFDKSAEAYDRFIDATNVSEKKKQAQALKEQVLAKKAEFGE